MIKQYATLPRPILILCLGTFVNRAGSMMVVFLTLYLKDELGQTPEFATLAPAAHGAGALVAAVLGGHLADSIGRRVVMIASMFGGGAILLVFGHLTSPWLIILAAGAFAMVMESYRPAASAMIADLVEPRQRAHAFGLMYISINLGFSIAPVLGSFLISKYSFLWLFRVDAFTSISYAVLILFTIAETLPSRRATPLDAHGTDRSNSDRKGVDRDDTQNTSFVAAVAHILHDRAFMILCLATICVCIAYSQAFTTFPLYLSGLGVDSKLYGYIIAANGVMIVCLQLPVTAVVTRYNRTNMMILGACLTAAGFGLIGLVHSPGFFVLTVVIWTSGEMVFAPLAPAIVTDMAPVNMRARYMGAFTVCFSLGMIAVPLAGTVLQRLGGAWLWGGTLAVGILAACLYASIRPHIDRVPQDKT